MQNAISEFLTLATWILNIPLFPPHPLPCCLSRVCLENVSSCPQRKESLTLCTASLESAEHLFSWILCTVSFGTVGVCLVGGRVFVHVLCLEWVHVIGAVLMLCQRLSFRSTSPSRRSRRWGAQLTSWPVHFTILNSMSWTGLSHYRGSCVGEPPSYIFHLCKYVVIFKVWLKNKTFWLVGVFTCIIMQRVMPMWTQKKIIKKLKLYHFKP